MLVLRLARPFENFTMGLGRSVYSFSFSFSRPDDNNSDGPLVASARNCMSIPSHLAVCAR